MTVHRERRRLPYSAEELFAVVDDVEAYPKFLPWCRAVRIRSRAEGEGAAIKTADVEISFKVYRETFTSEVTSDPAARLIRVRYIDGPFRRLVNEWRFEPVGEQEAIVDFHIDFEFKSRALQLLIGVLFDEAVRRMIAAFEGRAKALYGRRRVPAV